MAEPPSVLVAGSINVDIVVHAERLPVRGETVAGGRLERTGGGKGANQAIAAARAGAVVTLAGAVGDDDLGADALAELSADAVDVGAVRRLAGVATGVALIVVDAAGDNQIAVASGANHEVTAADVRAAARVSAGGAVGRLGCVLASFELLDEPVLAAARIAREAGCPLVVNPAPARPLEPALRELRPIVTPNRTEAAELTGEPDPEAAARALAALTGAPVVVTLGEQGALVQDGAGAAHVPAPAVRAVDTTGAGDTFNGVLAADLARGSELRAAVTKAVAAAAQSVTRPGARG
jgi:ribokinase